MDILELNNSDIYLSNNYEYKDILKVDYKNKVCIKPWDMNF
jgi:hypothetical protein